MKQVTVRLRAPIKTLYLNRKSKEKVQTTLFIESTSFFLTPSQKMNRPNLRRKQMFCWKKFVIQSLEERIQDLFYIFFDIYKMK